MSELDQVELLTGDGAVELLVKALGTEGSTILSWRVDSLHHRPAAGVSVGYKLQVRAADGTESTQLVCASTGRITRRNTPGLVRLDHAEGLVRVYMWRYPHDPELPALADANDEAAMSSVVGRPVTASVVTYRPTRRAVIRLDAGSDPAAFVKVVRPSTTANLIARHRILTDVGVPAPFVMHSRPDGLVMLSVASGTPLANFLAAGLPQPVATFDAVHRVLEALPPALTALPRHPAWADRVEFYAHAAATALPEHAQEATLLARSVQHAMATSDPGPIVATHGDYYEANIFMSGPATVASILDVDSVGPGFRVDDVGCLLGHVSVLPHLAPDVYPHVPPILDAWWNRAASLHDPRALAARAAAVTLSLVSGAKRPGVEEWRTDAVGRLRAAIGWMSRVGY